MTNLSQEAIWATMEAFLDSPLGAQIGCIDGEEVVPWIEAAAPFIAAQERERLRRELLSDEGVREITKQIVKGSEGEIISLAYQTVRDVLADQLVPESLEERRSR